VPPIAIRLTSTFHPFLDAVAWSRPTCPLADVTLLFSVYPPPTATFPAGHVAVDVAEFPKDPPGEAVFPVT
jgi:hypothetical protein